MKILESLPSFLDSYSRRKKVITVFTGLKVTEKHSLWCGSRYHFAIVIIVLIIIKNTTPWMALVGTVQNYLSVDCNYVPDLAC